MAALVMMLALANPALAGHDGDKQPGDILGGIGAGRGRDNSVLDDGAAVGLGRPRRPFGVLDDLAVVGDQLSRGDGRVPSCPSVHV